MDHEEPQPLGIRIMVIACKGMVIACAMLVLGVIGWNRYESEKAEAARARETAEATREWNKAVQQWNEDAKRREWQRQEIAKIKALQLASKQVARNAQ